MKAKSMLIVFCTIACLAASSLGLATSVISDSVDDKEINYCAWYMDSTPREVLPVYMDEQGKPYCHKEVTDIASGSHIVTASFVKKTDLWGEREGPKSAPFTFAVPAAPKSAPTNITVSVTVRPAN